MILKKLAGKGAVLIEGPKWCGKTTTAEQNSKSKIYISDPEKQKQYLVISDLNTFGFLFETMCIRDLRVFADALDGKIYHYRDKSGLECDAVIHLRNGKIGLIEIKLGGDKLIEEGACNLKKLADKIDTDKMKKPSFLMVLIATGEYAYRRNDGVYVVPIGCLRP